MSPRAKRAVGKVERTSLQFGGGSTFWSNKERERLLAALRKHGTTDLQKLADEVGTRNVNAVKVFLEMRARLLNQDPERAKKEGINAYLTHWAQLMHRAKESKYRTTDRALILTEILDEFAEGDFPEPTHDQEPNFKELYRYLADVMRDQIPAGLSATDAWVLKHLITSASDIARNMDLRPEKFALNSVLVQIENAAAYTGTVQGTENATAQYEDLPNGEQALQGGSGDNSNPSQMSQTNYSQRRFPSLGKRAWVIDTTWNPLQMPPEVLRQEHKTLAGILYGSGEKNSHKET